MQTLKQKLIITVATCILATTAHANLVSNGGFETGDFTGWSGVGNPGFRFVSTSDAHSGTYAGWFGAVGSVGGIVQTLVPTTPGGSYNFDFWLQNTSGYSEAQVYWNGMQVLGLANPGTFSYTHYAFNVVATAASTPIEFQFRNDPSFYRLDDINVNALDAVVPEPSTYIAGAMLALVFGVQGVRSLRSRKQAA